MLLASPVAAQQSGADQTIAAGPSPVIRLQMRSGTLIVRTWDRQQVEIASSVAGVQARHFGARAVANALAGGALPIAETRIQTMQGPLTLPPESFAIDNLSGAPHDGVLIFGGNRHATITLTVPASTALIWAMVGRGSIRMQGVHAGAFVTRVRAGGIALDNVSGQGYVEVARGPIFVTNSAIDRIRARTAIGNIIFEDCNARQIEVSSIKGSIAYDNGTFVPGLARFETQDGNIALGVASGGLQIGAHSSSGRIITSFDGGAANVTRSANDARAIVNGGGPVVTANSKNGAVYLYNGSLRQRPALQRRWRPGGLPARPRGNIFKARTCARPRCRA